MDKEYIKLWKFIDIVAYTNGLSASGLAKKAGLDSTAFNKSKRAYFCGKKRWLSMETISMVLEAVGMTWADFGAIMDRIEIEY